MRKWRKNDVAMIVDSSGNHGYWIGDLVVILRYEDLVPRNFPIYVENDDHDIVMAHDELYYIGRL